MTYLPQILIDIGVRKRNLVGFLNEHLDWNFRVIILELHSDFYQFIFVWVLMTINNEQFYLIVFQSIRVAIWLDRHPL